MLHTASCTCTQAQQLWETSSPLHIFVPLSSYCYYDCSFLSSLMPFQLCTWPLPLNTCFACYHNRLQVCLCMCISASFLRLSVCDFFSFSFFNHTIQVQTVPGKRSKLGRCTYRRREHQSLPQGQMTTERFCHLLIYSVVFCSNSSTSDTPHPSPP